MCESLAKSETSPLNGRDVGLLFGLDRRRRESGSGGARVNGMKVGSLDINLDGVTQLDRFGGGIVRVRRELKLSRSFELKPWGLTRASLSRPPSSWLRAAVQTNCTCRL